MTLDVRPPASVVFAQTQQQSLLPHPTSLRNEDAGKNDMHHFVTDRQVHHPGLNSRASAH